MNNYLKTYLKYRERAEFSNVQKFEIPFLAEKQKVILVKKTPFNIKLIPDPSEDVQLAAVEKDAYAIYNILNKNIVPSEKVQLTAVQKDGEIIDFIIKKRIKPSEKVQLAAVTQNGNSIEYISNPSEDVQIAAVENNPYSIRHLYYNNIIPSKDVQIAAVKKDPSVFK